MCLAGRCLLDSTTGTIRQRSGVAIGWRSRSAQNLYPLGTEQHKAVIVGPPMLDTIGHAADQSGQRSPPRGEKGCDAAHQLRLNTYSTGAMATENALEAQLARGCVDPQPEVVDTLRVVLPQYSSDVDEGETLPNDAEVIFLQA